MAKVWDYKIGDLVELTQAQYDFVITCFKHGGNMEATRKEYLVTDEQLEQWKKDPIFWPLLDGYLEVYARSRGLSVELIKQELLKGVTGKVELSKSQLASLNIAARALGMGASKTAFKANVSPESTTITFNDGMDNLEDGNDKH